MPELTSRSASSSGDASAASTIRSSRPSPSRTTRPYERASSGSNERIVPLAPSTRCVATRSRTTCGSRAGTSPFRTTTSLRASSSAARADRTASPVPSGRSCTATSRPSNDAAVSGEVTTTIRSIPASRAAAITQSTIRRPSSGCRCFGVALFMRVPRPPAMTTAARSAISAPSAMAGAPGFEPGIAGPKPAALPLGYAPLRFGSWSLPPVAEEQEEGDERERDDRDDHAPDDDEGDDRRDHRDDLRRGEDPRELAERIRARLTADAEVDRAGDDREPDHGPLRDVVEDRDQDRLDDRDPQRKAEPVSTQPAAEPARPVVDDAPARDLAHTANATTLAP